MSAAVMTVTPSRGWFTQDHAVFDPRTGEQVYTREKIVADHERKLLAGGVGGSVPLACWRQILDALPPGDVTGLRDLVAVEMRDFFDRVNRQDLQDEYYGHLTADQKEQFCQGVLASNPQLFIFHCGWSEAEGRVVAYVYDRAADFEPERVDAGHIVCPEPSYNDPGIDELRKRWDRAENGVQVHRFHKSMLANQYGAMERGELAESFGLTRTNSTATVDQDGVRIERVASLDDKAAA